MAIKFCRRSMHRIRTACRGSRVKAQVLAAFGLASSSFEFHFEWMKGFFAVLLMTFQKSQCFPNDFARRLITVRFYATLNEGIEFWADRRVHRCSVGRHP